MVAIMSASTFFGVLALFASLILRKGEIMHLSFFDGDSRNSLSLTTHAFFDRKLRKVSCTIA